MYLLDTNVISEARKGSKANPGVLTFLATIDEAGLYLSVQTIGELRRGAENLKQRGDREQATRLANWLDRLIGEYGDRILGFDLDCAQVWGRLMSPSPQHAIDKQIAAIALIYDMVVVTRNVDDFAGTGVRCHNPFV